MAKTQTASVTTTAQPVSTQPAITDEQAAHVKSLTTKAAQMRYLHGLGWKNGPIAKYLSGVYGKPVLYQHVRNQLNQPLKKSGG
jgi:hypothetical protein